MKPFTQPARIFFALITAMVLSACGDSDSYSSTIDTTADNPSNSVSPSSFLQATGNSTIVIPKETEECQTSLAVELMNTDVHREDPVLATHRELLFKCSAERSSIHAYKQSLLPENQLARRSTEIAPLEGLINFESPHVHPIDITPNGNTLVSVNTAAHTLEVWSINGTSISSIASIPVGLDPVSVRVRNDSEAWVVNHMSDSVSIVNLDSETVIQTLKTQNEPSDVIFAGSNRAFVSASEANSINIFDLNNLNADPTIIKIAGEEPRSLGVSADGNTVYAGIYESGNGTTFSGRRGSGNPIVHDDSIMDNDVAIINSSTLAVTYRRRLMNMVMAIGVNPSTQEVFAVGTKAANIIAGEPALKGKFITVNAAKFNGPGLNNASITDLNPHLDYTTATVSSSLRDQSLGDPRSIVWQQNGQRAFIAGMGSNNIAVIDGNGARVAHFDVGQGPTGIALKETANIGFVMNKFAGSISVINLNTLSQISEVEFDDPTPLVIKEGRPFIYDTHLTSGTGHSSCASCHVDSRTDRLGWQLSDEQDTPIIIPVGPNVVPGNATGTATFGSNKTIMLTQTLLDIMEHPRFHWRGDKESIDDFNGTFVNLMGRESVITQTQMDKMKGFLRTLWLPPNPYRLIDNSRPTTLTMPDGATATSNLIGPNATDALRGGAGRDCLGCHSGQGNTRNASATSQDSFGLPNLHLIAPAFPGYYDKIGFSMGFSGFGFFHDGTSNFREASRPGTTQHVAELLTLEGPEGPLVGDEVRQAPHAGVGQQVTINSNPTAAQLARLDQLVSIANKSSWAELIARSQINGSQRGFVLQQAESFKSDAVGQTATKTSLLSEATTNGNPVTFTIVAKGMSTRLALDSDLNGTLNHDEDSNDDGGTQGSNFTPTIDGNLSEWTSAQSIGVDGDDISIANSKADILEAWIANDRSNLYVAYLNDGPIDTATWWPWQLYIDTDGDASTGFQGNNGIGAEYILEASYLMKYTGTGSDWSWSFETPNVGVKNNDSAEFSINLQSLGNPSSFNYLFRANNGPFIDGFDVAAVDLIPNSGTSNYTLNAAANDGTVVSNILTPSLDGNLNDWSQAMSFGPDGNDISMTNAQADWLEAWMAHDTDNLYLAYTNDGPINYDTWWPWQTYLDTDNNPDTGFKTGGIGADFMVEGSSIVKYTGDGGSWSWQWMATAASGKGQSQVELRIPRSILGSIGSFKVHMKTRNVAFTNDFSAFGTDSYEGRHSVMEYNASP